MSTKAIGNRGELSVMRWLIERGCDVERMPPYWPFDLLADGKRIEVKNCAGTRDSWNWYVGRQNEPLKQLADLYIFRAESFTESTNLHFIIPRPILFKSFHLSRPAIPLWQRELQSFEIEY